MALYQAGDIVVVQDTQNLTDFTGLILNIIDNFASGTGIASVYTIRNLDS